MSTNKNISTISGFFITVLLTTAVEANPVINNVASGNVSINQSGNTETINQSSKSAIINWSSFNIGGNQATHFVQPAGGVTLNRINPTEGPSQIYGVLTATGQIILVNPAGIYFGPNSVVNVGGLIATTSGISKRNFLSGNYVFDHPTSYSGATILNQGQIIAAEHGLIALVGPNVTNNGLIKANLGHVVLASGDAFTVSFDPDNMINFTITKPTSQHGGVTNTGKLIANGGEIMVTATQASNVLDNAINMSGVAIAHSVSVHNGEIILSGQGTVNVSGRLIASSSHHHHHHNSTGGTVQLAGNDVNILSPAVIDASGDLGGGDIVISGNSSASIAAGASLFANALTNGNGGNISVTSNGVTSVYGNLSVTGGPLGGNGGEVETSGPALDVNGITVDASAPNGSTGDWLLDPTELYIENNGGTNSNINTPGSGEYVGDGDYTTSILDVSVLENELGMTNVTVETTGSGSGGGSGDIYVANNINWSNDNSLTISAFRNLYLNAQIVNTTGNGALTLIANNAIGGGPYDIGSGVGIVYQNASNSIDVKGPVTIYSNALNSGYGFTPYTNEYAGNTPTLWLWVNDAFDLQDLSTATSQWSDKFALNDNIYDAGTLASTIGTSSHPFSGTFNGNGYTINDLYIDLPSSNDVGLFGDLTGTVAYLNLTNANIHGDNEVGALAGYISGGGGLYDDTTSGEVYGAGDNIGGMAGELHLAYIADSSNYADVYSDDDEENIGGLAGYDYYGSITHSSNSGYVYAGESNEDVGGLIGERILGTVNYDFNAGDVYTEDDSDITRDVGGLIGDNFGDIYNSYNTGRIITGESDGTFLVGGLVGQDTYGDIINSYNTGLIWTRFAIAGSYYVGGLVGAANGDITNSYNTGDVIIGHSIAYNYGEDDDHREGIGGLAGYTDGNTSNSYNTGYVYVFSPFNDDMYNVGGLIGYNYYGNITNSYNTGTVQISGGGDNQSQFGGLVGVNIGGNISRSYNTGQLIVGDAYNYNDYIGGLVGYNEYGNIDQSFSSGAISVGPSYYDDDEEIGGLVGEDDFGNITNSYSRSPLYISSSSRYNNSIGGLVGELYYSSATNTYSAAPIRVGGYSYDIGGLIGYNGGSPVTSSYWDTQVSGLSSSAGGTGETTAAMMQQATFSGWDFNSIWGIYNGYTYPFLLAIPANYPAAPVIPPVTTTLSVSNIIQQPEQQLWGPESNIPLWLWVQLMLNGNINNVLNQLNSMGGLNNVTITCTNAACSTFTISSK